MLSRFTVLVFTLFFSHQLFSQDLMDLEGSWYAADGTNELKLYVDDDFVFYQSELWDIDVLEKGVLKIFNARRKTEISINQTGVKTEITSNSVTVPVIHSKQIDLGNRKEASTDLNEDYFINDQVLLQGVILPVNSMPKTISVIYNHAFSDDQKKFVSDVDEEGRFKIIYPLDNPQSVMVQIGNAFFSYLTTPGAKQVMIIDEKTFKGSWYEVHEIDLMGDLAIENEELRLLRPEFMKIRGYFENDSLQRALDSSEYLAFRLGLMETHQKFYQEYFDSIPVSEFVKDYSFRNTRIDAADDLMRYSWLHNRSSTSASMVPVNLSDDYLDKVKSLVEREKEELLADRYAGLNREFSMSLLRQDAEVIQAKQTQKVYDFLMERVTSDSAKVAVEDWRSEVDGKKSLSGVKFTNTEILELLNKYNEKLLTMAYMSRWDMLVEKLGDFGTVQKSSIVATFLDQSFLSQGRDIPILIQDQLADLGMQPQVLKGIQMQIDEFEAVKNSKFVEGIEITATSDNILSQLKEKYPGKVVYMDVWATWCGPCISEFGYLKELKKEEFEDVVFVYLCGQSPENSYEAMVKKHNLIGDNYFLDNEAFQEFDKEVGISGFPTYMVITKDGKLVREGINRPSSGAALVNQLKEFASR